MKKPFGFGYVFKSHFYSINEYLSKFKGYYNIEEGRRDVCLQHFAITFYLHQKISS